MASKTSKRRAGASKQDHAPLEKDDGTRWTIHDESGVQIYGGSGVTKREATRLAQGLVQPAAIRQAS